MRATSTACGLPGCRCARAPPRRGSLAILPATLDADQKIEQILHAAVGFDAGAAGEAFVQGGRGLFAESFQFAAGDFAVLEVAVVEIGDNLSRRFSTASLATGGGEVFLEKVDRRPACTRRCTVSAVFASFSPSDFQPAARSSSAERLGLGAALAAEIPEENRGIGTAAGEGSAVGGESQAGDAAGMSDEAVTQVARWRAPRFRLSVPRRAVANSVIKWGDADGKETQIGRKGKLEDAVAVGGAEAAGLLAGPCVRKDDSPLTSAMARKRLSAEKASEPLVLPLRSLLKRYSSLSLLERCSSLPSARFQTTSGAVGRPIVSYWEAWTAMSLPSGEKATCGRVWNGSCGRCRGGA